MIKANEIRIGNWITHNNTFVKPEMQVDAFLFKDNIAGDEFPEFDPIPLTPEIIEKCGFIEEQPHYLELYGYRDFIMDNCVIRISSDIVVFIKRTEADNITHLHQLQNLYFALTGKEIEYTP